MKILKSGFNPRIHLRAERKGEKERGGNPTYVTMAYPQSNHSLLHLPQRQRKNCSPGNSSPGNTSSGNASTRRHSEMISHSVLSSLFRFITLKVFLAGIFAVVANMMIVSNLMFPKFLQKSWEDCHGGLWWITLTKRSLQTLETRTAWD